MGVPEEESSTDDGDDPLSRTPSRAGSAPSPGVRPPHIGAVRVSPMGTIARTPSGGSSGRVDGGPVTFSAGALQTAIALTQMRQPPTTSSVDVGSIPPVVPVVSPVPSPMDSVSVHPQGRSLLSSILGRPSIPTPPVAHSAPPPPDVAVQDSQIGGGDIDGVGLPDLVGLSLPPIGLVPSSVPSSPTPGEPELPLEAVLSPPREPPMTRGRRDRTKITLKIPRGGRGRRGDRGRDDGAS